MRHADMAMYHAKNSGRDQVVFFSAAMNQAIWLQIELEHALRGAVERGEFRVEYQPVVRLSDGQVVGAEALLRWRHPGLGEVSPAEFITVAEQTGQIEALGAIVLSDTLARLKRWRERVPEFRVSINISPAQFRHPGFATRLSEALAGHGLDGSALVIEVTEGLLLSDHPGLRTIFSDLARSGVRLLMDDFGTGYSSLGYLRDFPFGGIKIDRSFISGLDRDQRKRKLVRSAIRLGRALELVVIAEGVEREEELAALAEEGCDLVQGYLLFRPMPPEAVDELLATGPRVRLP